MNRQICPAFYVVLFFFLVLACGRKPASFVSGQYSELELSANIPSPFFEEEFPEFGRADVELDPLERELREVRDFVGGVLKSTITAYDDVARRIAFSPYSSRFYLVGRVNSNNAYNHDFLLARIHPDGTMDNDFSGDGVDVLDIQGAGRYEVAHAITVQSDGRVVIGGKVWNGYDHDWGLARYLTNGVLDSDWNGNGKLIHTISTNATEILRGLAFQTDGKIVAAGYAYNGSDYDFAVVRYNTNGSIDSDFGVRTTEIQSNRDDCATSVVVANNGQIIVAGATYYDEGMGITSWDLATVRYNTDGSLHTDYGGSGTGKRIHQISAAGDEIFWDVALDANQKIVAVGQGVDSDTDFLIVRYLTNGTNDASFSYRYVDFGGTDIGRSLAIQKNGKIIVAGDKGGDFAVARLLPDGELDTGFSSDGMNTTTIGSGADVAHGVAVSGNGYILTGGRYYNGSNHDLAVARWDVTGNKVSSGVLDKLFNSTGKVTQSSKDAGDQHDSATGGVATYSDGTMIAAGYCGSTGDDSGIDYCLMRFKPDGSLDSNFGTSGIRRMSFGPAMPGTDRAYGVAIQSDGKIVVSGTYEEMYSGYGVARFLTDGTLDTTFNTTGYRTNPQFPFEICRSMALQADGKIVIGCDDDDNFVIYRLNTAGGTDNSFGSSGQVTADLWAAPNRSYGLAVMTTGNIVVVGRTSAAQENFTVAMLRTNGALETDFGSSGFAAHTYTAEGTNTWYAVTIQRDGKIVAAGQSTGGNDVVVGRYLTSGALDTTFDSDGLKGFDPTNDTANTKARAVYALPNDKILVAGSEETGEVFVARFHPNGSLDTSFNTTGIFVDSFHGTPTGNIYGMTVASDGRIIIAGGDKDHSGTDHDFALMRIWP